MSKRNESVKYLKEAEVALVGAIADEVLNHGPNLAESLSGEVYASTEKLFEMADNLHRLKILIAEMPVDVVLPTDNRPIWETTEPVSAPVVMPQLSPSQSFAAVMLGAQPQANMRVFLDKVHLGKLEEAAHDLSLLTGLPLQYAVNSTALFASKLQNDPDIEGQLMSLRAQLHTSVNGSLILMHTLFGISGPAALNAVSTMRSMV